MPTSARSPVTKKELGQALRKALSKHATKRDLEKYATKEDLKHELETALSKYATKEDLKRELSAYATKNDLDERTGQILSLMESQMGTYLELHQRLKDELTDTMERWKSDLAQMFYAFEESIRREVRGMQSIVQNHEHRIGHLEEHTGLRAA